MKIYDVLKEDHQKVRNLMQRLVSLGEKDQAEGTELIAKIRDELVPHSRAEEAVFYNSIRAISTAQDLAWHGYEEHMEIEALLRSLQAMDKINLDWTKVAKRLQTAFEHHVNEEETRIIPVAEQLFTDDEAMVMAEAFEEMKPEVREGSIFQNTLDMIANMMPARLAAPLRTYSYRV